jgi:enoyl-CoA hydratase/carnithine racemase
VDTKICFLKKIPRSINTPDQLLRISISCGKLNTMVFDFHHSLTDIWRYIEDDDTVSVVILTEQGEKEGNDTQSKRGSLLRANLQ